MEFLKKRQDVSVSQGQVLLKNLSKFAKMLLHCGLFQENPFNHNPFNHNSELLEFLNYINLRTMSLIYIA